MVHLGGQVYHEKSQDILCGHKPRFATTEALKVNGIDQGGPEQFETEGPKDKTEESLVRVAHIFALQNEWDASRQAEGNALKHVEKKQQQDAAELRSAAPRGLGEAIDAGLPQKSFAVPLPAHQVRVTVIPAALRLRPALQVQRVVERPRPSLPTVVLVGNGG